MPMLATLGFLVFILSVPFFILGMALFSYSVRRDSRLSRRMVKPSLVLCALSFALFLLTPTITSPIAKISLTVSPPTLILGMMLFSYSVRETQSFRTGVVKLSLALCALSVLIQWFWWLISLWS
jgi:hypothetical protein